MTKSLLLKLPYTDDPDAVNKLDQLGVILRRHRGQTPVFLSIRDSSGKQAQLKLNDEFRVNPANLKLDDLEMLLGSGSVLFTR